MSHSVPNTEATIDGSPSAGADAAIKTTSGAAPSTADFSSSPSAQSQQADEPPMSKNALKKKRKWEKKMEIKKRRKLQEKEVKKAKARAQGRDIEQEQRQQAANRAAKKSQNRRNEKWEREKLPLMEKSFQVCVDCAFQDHMTPKEINSLALQLRYCYSINKRNPHPCRLTATSVTGSTLKHLQNVSGFEDWSKLALTVTSESLEEYYCKQDQSKSADGGAGGSTTRLDNVVYLTSDSDTLLEDLDDSKVYVVGGIVDRNRLKRATLDRANRLGVSTARLPIDEHLRLGDATRVLTVNTVFELLLKYREPGRPRDWKKALLQVLPHRKEAKALENDDDNSGLRTTRTATADDEKDEQVDKKQPHKNPTREAIPADSSEGK